MDHRYHRHLLDASRPSDLERLLEHGNFSAHTLERAALLRAEIVSAGLTKYNVGGRTWKRPETTNAFWFRVRSSATIRYAGRAGHQAQYRSVARSKKRCPDVHVIYKPHLMWLPVCAALESTRARIPVVRRDRRRRRCWRTALPGRRSPHDDVVDRLRGLAQAAPGCDLRPAFLRRLGPDGRQTPDFAPHPKTHAGRTGRRRAAAVSPLSKPHQRKTDQCRRRTDELLAWKEKRAAISIKSVVRAPIRHLLRWAGNR